LDKPNIDPVSKNRSLLDVAQSGLGELSNDDTDDDGLRLQNFAAAAKKNNGLDNLDSEDSDDDIDYDDNDDVVVRQRPELADGIKQNDLPSPVEYYSPSQSPAEQPQPVNGGHNLSDAVDDEEVSEYEDASAIETVVKDDRKSPLAAVLNTQELSQENSHSKDNPPPAELASSSTFASSVMKFFSFNTRSPVESSAAASSVSSMSGTMSKMSTKDARNRFVVLLLFVVSYYISAHT